MGIATFGVKVAHGLVSGTPGDSVQRRCETTSRGNQCLQDFEHHGYAAKSDRPRFMKDRLRMDFTHREENGAVYL